MCAETGARLPFCAAGHTSTALAATDTTPPLCAYRIYILAQLLAAVFACSIFAVVGGEPNAFHD
jgi:hypothetical protein